MLYSKALGKTAAGDQDKASVKHYALPYYWAKENLCASQRHSSFQGETSLGNAGCLFSVSQALAT